MLYYKAKEPPFCEGVAVMKFSVQDLKHIRDALVLELENVVVAYWKATFLAISVAMSFRLVYPTEMLTGIAWRT